MIVVADTSPLNYLILIDEIHLLQRLFGQVVLPQAVLDELQHPGTPSKVRQWIAQPPEWLVVHSVSAAVHPALMRLDPGEREAIQLALELHANIILLDESEGRRLAETFQLEVRGTLGILERGAKLGMVSFRQALARLEQTSFRISPTIREAFLRRNS